MVVDDWDNFDNIISVSPYSSLPSSVDNTLSFPVPGDQGSQKNCAAWAVGYSLKSGSEIVKRNWSRTSTAHCFSPSYVFNQLNGGTGNGISIAYTFNLVVSQGVCSLNYFPYNASDYTTQPTDVQKAAAAMYKAQSWNGIIGISTIKSYIANNQGVVIGINVYPDFDDISSENEIYDTVYGTLRGGHAVCLIGYDDSRNAFKFINSWGTDWGLDGYGWISYDLVNSSAVNLHGEGKGYIVNAITNDDYVLGDVNGDGTISAVDSQMILKHTSGESTLSNEQFVLGDVNGDAKVSAVDSRCILQYVAGTITKFPLYD